MLNAAQIRQFLFIILVSSLFLLLFWTLKSFIPALLGAYTLFVLLQKPVTYLTNIRKWPATLATGVVMLLSFLLILLPFYGLVYWLTTKLLSGSQGAQYFMTQLQNAVQQLETRMGIVILTPEHLQNLTDWGFWQASGFANATITGLLMLIVAYFILWFMLRNADKMGHSIFHWMPLEYTKIAFLQKELNNLVYANALGIPLMGIVQGTAGLLGYSLIGVHELWFWVFVTFITGMIPFVGVTLAFIPLAVMHFVNGMMPQAIFILIYGFVVIGSVDNLARMWFLNKIGHTHPMITLFGVIAGLQLFGFIGFIFGPILIAMFLLLGKIFMAELGQTEPTAIGS